MLPVYLNHLLKLCKMMNIYVHIYANITLLIFIHFFKYSCLLITQYKIIIFYKFIFIRTLIDNLYLSIFHSFICFELIFMHFQYYAYTVLFFSFSPQYFESSTFSLQVSQVCLLASLFFLFCYVFDSTMCYHSVLKYSFTWYSILSG